MKANISFFVGAIFLCISVASCFGGCAGKEYREVKASSIALLSFDSQEEQEDFLHLKAPLPVVLFTFSFAIDAAGNLCFTEPPCVFCSVPRYIINRILRN